MASPFSKLGDQATYAWLMEQSQGQRGRILVLSLLSTVQAALLVGFALACRAIIDAAVAGDAPGLVAGAAALAGIVVGQLLLRLANNSIQEHIRARLSVSLRQSLLEHLLACSYGSALKYHSGELSNRMFSDVQVVANGVASIVPNSVAMAMQLVFCMAALAFLSPAMVLLFAVSAVFAFVAARLMRARMKAMLKDVQEKEGAVRVFLQEVLGHQLVIRSFGAQGNTTSHASHLQEDHFASQMKRRTYSIAANASFGFFFNVLYVVTLVWCAYELLQGTMGYGTLMAVIQLVGRIQAPVANLSGLLPQLYQTTASAERLMEVTDLPRAANRLPLSAQDFYSAFKGISISNLAFAYDDAAEGEQNLVCRHAFVPKGAFVLVSGPSGSGKSTLFKLILGAYGAKGFDYQLAKGEARQTTQVLVGESCQATQVPAGVFAYVPQESFLLAGTVRENVIFAAPHASDAQVQKACEAACAWDFIQGLPRGLDTVIGENGQGLSQGQLQRVAIARALCSGAPILVLDEVTSALDDATEAQVLANIAALKGKTIIVAAHRAKAKDFATAQLLVEKGEITTA